MEAVRDKWTDERLDDLKGQMTTGFAHLDADLREVRSEISGVRSEMAAYHRTMLQLSVGTIGTTALGFLGLIVTQL